MHMICDRTSQANNQPSLILSLAVEDNTANYMPAYRTVFQKEHCDLKNEPVPRSHTEV